MLFQSYNRDISKLQACYFKVSGLLLHLLKISEAEQFQTHPIKGNLFENLIIAEYVKRKHHTNSLEDIWFWRDSSGREIDLLIDEGKNMKIIEIKAGNTIMPKMFDSLSWFEDLSGIKDLEKILVYGGNESQQRSAGKVVSWLEFLKQASGQSKY